VDAVRPRSFAESVVCAWRGFHRTARTEPHFRAHLLIAAAVLAAGVVLGLTPTELAVVALTIGLVLTAELVNTAVELLTDLLHPDIGARAAAVKDVSAGAVLITVVAAVAVGISIFLPHLIARSGTLVRAVPLVLAAALVAALVAVLIAGPGRR
jgi:diacylglycerol kinase